MKIDKKFVLSNLPYLFILWLADKLSYVCRINKGYNLITVMGELAEFYKAPLFSFHLTDICIGVLGALAVRGILYVRSLNAKKYRKQRASMYICRTTGYSERPTKTGQSGAFRCRRQCFT